MTSSRSTRVFFLGILVTMAVLYIFLQTAHMCCTTNDAAGKGRYPRDAPYLNNIHINADINQHRVQSPKEAKDEVSFQKELAEKQLNQKEGERNLHNNFSTVLKDSQKSSHILQDEIDTTDLKTKEVVTSAILNSKARASFFWEPFVSLHAVKHLFNINPPHDFTGNKLKSLIEQSKAHKRQSANTSLVCPEYFKEVTLRKTVFPNFIGKCFSGFQSDDVTLLIQMDKSVGYFDKLNRVIKYWKGPISVALFVNSSNSDELREENLRVDIENIFTKYKLRGGGLCIHVVTSHDNLNYYPVNTLRNVATRFAQTDVVFLIEADFIPMPGLNKVFRRPMLKSNLLNAKVAYIVPAFGTLYYNQTVPRSKNELLAQWQNNITIPIHQTKSFKHGHRPTEYKRYRYYKRAYRVPYQMYYEPYYVVHRKRVPYYPEEFLLGFKDKSIHAHMLNATGFEFHVLPNTFIIHTPHRKQYSRDMAMYLCAFTASDDFVKSCEPHLKYYSPEVNTKALKVYIESVE